MATHNRMFERQISQVTQQQVSPFAPPIIFSRQSKLNLKGHLNVVTLRNGKQLDDLNEKDKTNSEVVEEEKHKSYISYPPYKPSIHFLRIIAKLKN